MLCITTGRFYIAMLVWHCQGKTREQQRNMLQLSFASKADSLDSEPQCSHYEYFYFCFSPPAGENGYLADNALT